MSLSDLLSLLSPPSLSVSLSLSPSFSLTLSKSNSTLYSVSFSFPPDTLYHSLYYFALLIPCDRCFMFLSPCLHIFKVSSLSNFLSSTSSFPVSPSFSLSPCHTLPPPFLHCSSLPPFLSLFCLSLAIALPPSLCLSLSHFRSETPFIQSLSISFLTPYTFVL